jgi:hypothetical protein
MACSFQLSETVFLITAQSERRSIASGVLQQPYTMLNVLFFTT